MPAPSRRRHRLRGRWVSLLLAAWLVAACVPPSILTGHAATVSAPPVPDGDPVGSPGDTASPAPSPVPSSDAHTTPDISPDPLPAAPSLPPFQPPGPVSPSPAAAGLVLHVPVLMYHRIVPRSLAGDSLPSLVVPPDMFAAQMDALAAAGWRAITAAQLATDLATGERPAPRTLVITFDDGYDDGYTYALPILEAHHFMATFFVIAGRVGEARPTGELTPAHVRVLASAGMEVANHTWGHRDLALLSGIQLRYQVVAASARIAELVGAAPRTLAYPYGHWNATAAAETHAAGMTMAFTTVEGARETWASRYSTPRLRVGPGTTPADLLALLRRYAG